MKDPLFGNKVAFCLLFALLLFFGLPQIAAAVFGGGHGGGHGGELHLAYPIEFETTGESVKAAAKVDLGTLLAGASAAAGERRAAICKSCHTFDQGGANGTGPNLYGIVGRAVASHGGFNYTPALQQLGGAWSYERLDEYLKNSQGYVPGTAMVQRFPKDDQRADLLAYLQTLAPSPVPFPEPAPAATEEGEAEAHGGATEGPAAEQDGETPAAEQPEDAAPAEEPQPTEEPAPEH